MPLPDGRPSQRRPPALHEAAGWPARPHSSAPASPGLPRRPCLGKPHRGSATGAPFAAAQPSALPAPLSPPCPAAVIDRLGEFREVLHGSRWVPHPLLSFLLRSCMCVCVCVLQYNFCSTGKTGEEAAGRGRQLVRSAPVHCPDAVHHHKAACPRSATFHAWVACSLHPGLGSFGVPMTASATMHARRARCIPPRPARLCLPLPPHLCLDRTGGTATVDPIALAASVDSDDAAPAAAGSSGSSQAAAGEGEGAGIAITDLPGSSGGSLLLTGKR